MRLRAVRTARKPRDSGRKAVKRVGYLTGYGYKASAINWLPSGKASARPHRIQTSR